MDTWEPGTVGAFGQSLGLSKDEMTKLAEKESAGNPWSIVLTDLLDETELSHSAAVVAFRGAAGAK